MARAPSVGQLFGMSPEELDRYAGWAERSSRSAPQGSRMIGYLKDAARAARNAGCGEFYKDADWAVKW